MRNVSDVKTHKLCSTFSKNQGTNDNAIQRMCFAYWIPKAIYTHILRICNCYCFSTATTVKRTHLNVALYVLPILLNSVGTKNSDHKAERPISSTLYSEISEKTAWKFCIYHVTNDSLYTISTISSLCATANATVYIISVLS